MRRMDELHEALAHQWLGDLTRVGGRTNGSWISPGWAQPTRAGAERCRSAPADYVNIRSRTAL